MSEGGLFAGHALLPGGWARDVALRWDDGGRFSRIEPGARPDGLERARGVAIPGMPNLHCHAFQRAMAGLAEYRAGENDSFWSWRELMYQFAAKISPEAMYDVARQVYIEMLKAGYSSVCEFHYVHHAPDGSAYENPEMAASVIRAARDAGIGMTFLPVLYQYSGFGERPPLPAQRRFLGTPDGIFDTIARLRRAHPEHDGLRYGIAPHSLRAVSEGSLRIAAGAMEPTMPAHIHIAEQVPEVEACIAHTGSRPVEWLLDRFDVDHRWCLVHATHMTAAESARLARSGAVAGLCPTTEANLGDGIFDAVNYFGAGGRWGIGSDSNISVSAADELRTLEYGQRLRDQRRNAVASAAAAESGELLFRAAVEGGAQASGRPVAGLSPGQRADFVVLDESHPSLAGRPVERLLSAFVFCNHGAPPVRDVYVGGTRIVADGRHPDEAAAAEGYRRALAALLRA